MFRNEFMFVILSLSVDEIEWSRCLHTFVSYDLQECTVDNSQDVLTWKSSPELTLGGPHVIRYYQYCY